MVEWTVTGSSSFRETFQHGPFGAPLHRTSRRYIPTVHRRCTLWWERPSSRKRYEYVGTQRTQNVSLCNWQYVNFENKTVIARYWLWNVNTWRWLVFGCHVSDDAHTFFRYPDYMLLLRLFSTKRTSTYTISRKQSSLLAFECHVTNDARAYFFVNRTICNFSLFQWRHRIQQRHHHQWWQASELLC